MKGILKHGNDHYTASGYTGQQHAFTCACGCGEVGTWDGIGRPREYINDVHKVRAYRRRASNNVNKSREGAK